MARKSPGEKNGVDEIPVREMTANTPTRDMLAHAERQSRSYGLDDYLIVDVDAHHFETKSWASVIKYIEDPVLRDLAEHIMGPERKGPAALLNYQPGLNFQNVAGRIPHSGGIQGEPIDDTSVHPDVILARRAMESLSIDFQVMFPTPMLGLGLHPRPDFEIALSWAYNRWLTEEVLPGEPKLGTMLYLPFSDGDAALRTIKEFAGRPGVVGFMVTAVRHRPVHHNQFMKVYSLLNEIGLPLGFHAGPTWEDEWTSQLDRFIGVHAISFVLCNLVHMTNWILHGLPERFPNLPVVWIESGLAWVPFLMQRLDNEYLMRSSEAPLLTRLPSEYMQEMFYTCQPMEKTNPRLLKATLEAIKAETQLLYASDWPHWDFDFPSVIMEIPGLSERAKRNILGETAARLFKLDIPRLARAAAE